MVESTRHDRRDMMAVCPNCHRAITKRAVPVDTQRQWKALPHNIANGFANGQLLLPTATVALQMGANLFVGPGPKLVVDNAPVVSISADGKRSMLVSVDLRDRNDRVILTLVDNEWVTGDIAAWDIEFNHNRLRIQSAVHETALELDARSDVVKLAGHLWTHGVQFDVSPSALVLHDSTTGAPAAPGEQEDNTCRPGRAEEPTEGAWPRGPLMTAAPERFSFSRPPSTLAFP